MRTRAHPGAAVSRRQQYYRTLSAMSLTLATLSRTFPAAQHRLLRRKKVSFGAVQQCGVCRPDFAAFHPGDWRKRARCGAN
jgi:hypothetical protein